MTVDLAPAPSDAPPELPPDIAPPGSPPAGSPPPGSPPSRARKARGCLFEIVETLVLTLVIFVVLQNFVAQPFQVQMKSMERTFVEGDYVLVDRLSHLWSPYGRGQVIVFQPPPTWADATKPFIKRVIGVAGDTIELRDGRVYVNDVAIDEPYLFRDAAGVAEPTDEYNQSEWLVPDGELFVMGDHRQSSADSRVFGTIPVSTVIGRALLRYWPVSQFGIVQTPTYDNLPAP
jgi:signal peptidase I